MVNLDLGDTALIIAEAKKCGVLRNQLAYILATAKWETAHTMKPVRETLATSDAQAMARLEKAYNSGKLPWVKTPYWRDGYFGRGYVQLTHEDNYRRADRNLKLGGVLVESPDEALEPDIATKVLVWGMLEGWFTGHKLSDHITLKRSDFVQARRIVNGTDKAHEIAALAQDYDSALLSAGYGVEPVDTPVYHPDPAEAPGGIGAIIAQIFAAIAALFRRKK